MHARATIIKGSKDRADEAIHLIQDQVIPTVRKMKGFKGGYWLLDREGGKTLGVTLWETEEDMLASEQAANELRSRVVATGIVSGEPTIERYEVLAVV